MKTSLLIVTLSAFLGFLSISASASESCGKDETAPLPDCVKVVPKGSGKVKLQNYCDYDVDVKINKSVEFDERYYLKSHHEKNIVSRAAITFSCCWKSTPECRAGE
jgi:hypothetical protein